MLCGMSVSLRVACVSFPSLLLLTAPAAAQDDCFVRLDTGTDTSGWHVSSTNHHGPGSGWTVEDGAFVGRQSAGQQGGILMTDAVYRDVEVVFQVKIDWGCDSGFFFRTTAGDRAYQVNVDHLEQAGVGTIWGESFAQELRVIPYFLTDMGNAAVKASPDAMPQFDLAKWPTLWKPTEFNEIRARVEGNPPHMQVWISGEKVMDFTDQTLRAEIEEEGPLAIQVHAGSRWIPNGTVRYKNIRVRDLSLPCADPEPGSGGSSGAGGAAGSSAGTSAEAGSAGAGAGGAPGSSGSPSAGSGGVTAGASSSEPVAGSGGAADGPTTSSSERSGCGCAIPGSARSTEAGLVLTVLALALRSARRRRAQPS
jgi:hypothetical protein